MRKPSSNNRYFTPPWLMDIVREITGEHINLDPFSEKLANDFSVHAIHYFTENDDALSQVWDIEKPIWCNPPYITRVMDETVNRLSESSCSFLLCNSNTSSGWYQKAARNCTLGCFLTDRVKFYRIVDNKITIAERPERDNTLFLFTDKEDVLTRFMELAGNIGVVSEFL